MFIQICAKNLSPSFWSRGRGRHRARPLRRRDEAVRRAKLLFQIEAFQKSGSSQLLVSITASFASCLAQKMKRFNKIQKNGEEGSRRRRSGASAWRWRRCSPLAWGRGTSSPSPRGASSRSSSSSAPPRAPCSPSPRSSPSRSPPPLIETIPNQRSRIARCMNSVFSLALVEARQPDGSSR